MVEVVYEAALPQGDLLNLASSQSVFVMQDMSASILTSQPRVQPYNHLCLAEDVEQGRGQPSLSCLLLGPPSVSSLNSGLSSGHLVLSISDNFSLISSSDQFIALYLAKILFLPFFQVPCRGTVVLEKQRGLQEAALSLLVPSLGNLRVYVQPSVLPLTSRAQFSYKRKVRFCELSTLHIQLGTEPRYICLTFYSVYQSSQSRK